MSAPRMFIIAGPPGAGKSSFYSRYDFEGNAFNADDRAAELNSGSYENIPIAVRARVNREFEEFVHAKIHAGSSFALETTLRSSVTFDQARLARDSGFLVSMRYLALENVGEHIERVKRRAARGGHSASEGTLRRIHSSSLANLAVALMPQESGIETVRIYDNSRFQSRPRLVLSARRGRIVRVSERFPEWLQSALGWTDDDLERHRANSSGA